jgi:hypothetical protein
MYHALIAAAFASLLAPADVEGTENAIMLVVSISNYAATLNDRRQSKRRRPAIPPCP